MEQLVAVPRMPVHSGIDGGVEVDRTDPAALNSIHSVASGSLMLTDRRRSASGLRCRFTSCRCALDAGVTCAHWPQALCVGRACQATRGDCGLDLGSTETIQSCLRGLNGAACQWPGRPRPAQDR